MESNDHASNDIENRYLAMVVSLRKELESWSPISSVCYIYRVPEPLRLANEKFYTPQIVSIGALHHGKEALKAMEEHKKRCLRVETISSKDLCKFGAIYKHHKGKRSKVVQNP